VEAGVILMTGTLTVGRATDDAVGVGTPLDTSPADTAVEVETEAQPAAPPASSAVRAMQGHLTDRARILARPPGLPGAGTSGDVA
jgi:hypothetical protein